MAEPREEALPLQNLGSSTSAGSSDQEGVPSGSRHSSDAPLIRVINVPIACVRRTEDFVLNRLPIRDTTRMTLKTRWYGTCIAISVIVFVALLIAGLLTGITLLIKSWVNHGRKTAEPFKGWPNSTGPNDRTIFPLPETVEPIEYKLFFNLDMDKDKQNLHYQGRVAISVEVDSPVTAVDRFLIHAHKTLDIDFHNFIIVDYSGYIDQLTTAWDAFPYIDQDGIIRPGINETEATSTERLPFPKERFRRKIQTFDRYEVPTITRLDDDTLEVKVGLPLQNKDQKVILIRFNGTATQNPPGIFVGRVVETHELWLATQFQPSLARTAFPCFDEPGFRATFSLSVAHPANYTALGNMPATRRRHVINTDVQDYVWTVFHLSAVMPPYLVGFVVGPFTELELRSPGSSPETKIWSLSQDDLRLKTLFAANITVKALQVCRDYFQTDFPLPKLHIVAVPLDHPIESVTWGLTLYRNDDIMVNTTTATAASLEEVARNVVHYIIHQYVGNLVGPDSWDDMWATQALIGFLENEILEEVFPDWHVWDNFATLTVGELMKIDVLEGEHTVFAMPRIPIFPTTVFDSFTSLKGAAIFRMLDKYSPRSVQKAVQTYLSGNTGDAVSAGVLLQDLHEAVHANARDDRPTIVELLNKWTRETAYPLVSVIRYKFTADVSLYQEVFSPQHMINMSTLETNEIPPRKCHLANRHQRVSGKTVAWSVPLHFSVLNRTFRETDTFWQTTNFHRVCGGFHNRYNLLLLNDDQKGYFRVDYDHANWLLMGHQMNYDPKVFSKVTRSMLIDDAMTLAKLSRVTFSDALMLPFGLMHQGIGEEVTATDVGMFERAMRAVADVYDILRGSDLQAKMLEYMKIIVTGQWQAVNPPERRKLERKSIQNLTDVLAKRNSIMLQEQAIFWACYASYGQCTNWAVSIVQEWEDNYPPLEEEDIIEEHYSNAYCAAVRYGPSSLFDFLWSRLNDFSRRTLPDSHRREIMWALLCTSDVERMSRVLNGLARNRVLVEDTIALWKKMTTQDVSAWYAFKYERTYWNNIRSKMYKTSFFHQVIVAITSALSTSEDLEEIQIFRKVHNETLLPVQDVLEENVHNIRRKLFFRSTIEDDFKNGIKEIFPMLEALQVTTDNWRHQGSSPSFIAGFTESPFSALTPHPF